MPSSNIMAAYLARLPALILWGECDHYVPVAHGKAFHAAIADSKFTVIPRAGPSRSPEECAKLMLAFMRERDG